MAAPVPAAENAALEHQGLDPPPPAKGTGAAITWGQAYAMLSGRLYKHVQGTSIGRMTLENGVAVPEAYAPSYARAILATIEGLRRELAREAPENDLVPTLRDAERVLAHLRTKHAAPSAAARVSLGFATALGYVTTLFGLWKPLRFALGTDTQEAYRAALKPAIGANHAALLSRAASPEFATPS